MTESNHLCDLWECTIAKVFKHDPKSELGLVLKPWVILNKLENFNSLLNYTIDDFTPSGNLCYSLWSKMWLHFFLRSVDW